MMVGRCSDPGPGGLVMGNSQTSDIWEERFRLFGRCPCTLVILSEAASCWFSLREIDSADVF